MILRMDGEPRKMESSKIIDPIFEDDKLRVRPKRFCCGNASQRARHCEITYLNPQNAHLSPADTRGRVRMAVVLCYQDEFSVSKHSLVFLLGVFRTRWKPEINS